MKYFILGAIVFFVTVSSGALWLSYTYPPTQGTFATSPNVQGMLAVDVVQGTVLSREEALRHATSGDCWLIVRGNVYDVSRYVSSHPGGRKSILQSCGKEVSSIFASIHSNRAWDLLGRYRIGSLDGTLGSTSVASSNSSDIQAVQDAVAQSFPDGEVLSVEPFRDGFLARVATTANTLYDVIVDKDGVIESQEERSGVFDWFWEKDEGKSGGSGSRK